MTQLEFFSPESHNPPRIKTKNVSKFDIPDPRKTISNESAKSSEEKEAALNYINQKLYRERVHSLDDKREYNFMREEYGRTNSPILRKKILLLEDKMNKRSQLVSELNKKRAALMKELGYENPEE